MNKCGGVLAGDIRLRHSHMFYMEAFMMHLNRDLRNRKRQEDAIYYISSDCKFIPFTSHEIASDFFNIRIERELASLYEFMRASLKEKV